MPGKLVGLLICMINIHLSKEYAQVIDVMKSKNKGQKCKCRTCK